MEYTGESTIPAPISPVNMNSLQLTHIYFYSLERSEEVLRLHLVELHVFCFVIELADIVTQTKV